MAEVDQADKSICKQFVLLRTAVRYASWRANTAAETLMKDVGEPMVPTTAAAAAAGGPTAREMVSRIFTMLEDRANPGWLSFDALRTLAARTGGDDIDRPTYEAVCAAAGCLASSGIDRAGLARVYLELGMGDARNDFEKLNASQPNGSPTSIY